MNASAALHILAYIVLGEIGGLSLWVSVKASIYASREWKRRDRFWTWFHAKDVAIYAVIGASLVVGAWKMLQH